MPSLHRESTDSLIKAAVKVWNYPQSSAKEHPSKENSNILKKNFDLSAIDHIGQLLQ